MKVSSALIRSYGDMAALTVRQNKPKQSQFQTWSCLAQNGEILSNVVDEVLFRLRGKGTRDLLWRRFDCRALFDIVLLYLGV